jgi:hypothetical protein
MDRITDTQVLFVFSFRGGVGMKLVMAFKYSQLAR